MQFFNKIIVDIASGSILEQDSFEYTGPVAQAISGSGGKSKSSNESSSQQSSESGTEFNEDFLTRALQFFGPGKKAITTQPGAFDEARYLRENPDVAGNPLFASQPQEHWRLHGQAEGRKYPGDAGGETVDVANLTPTYDPSFIRSAFKPTTFTGAAYTPVEGGDFNRIEENLFQGEKSRLADTYNRSVARQNEEIAQMGGLNSPTRFLEGTARTALDRGFLENVQQAARDAATTSLGLKAGEAARRTGFDVGEATRRTGYDVTEGGRETEFGQTEAGRETQFNEATAARILDVWFKKLALAIESGRFTRGQGSSQATGQSSSISGSGGIAQGGGSGTTGYGF